MEGKNSLGHPLNVMKTAKTDGKTDSKLGEVLTCDRENREKQPFPIWRRYGDYRRIYLYHRSCFFFRPTHAALPSAPVRQSHRRRVEEPRHFSQKEEPLRAIDVWRMMGPVPSVRALTKQVNRVLDVLASLGPPSDVVGITASDDGLFTSFLPPLTTVILLVSSQ